jgi:hypothetical protein
MGEVRHLNESERRRLMTEQAALTALTQHPSWPNLVEAIEKKERRLERTALALVFGSPTGIDLEKQAYLRGVRDGMRYMISVPTNAEARLENVLRAQGIASEGE